MVAVAQEQRAALSGNVVKASMHSESLAGLNIINCLLWWGLKIFRISRGSNHSYFHLTYFQYFFFKCAMFSVRATAA